MEVQLAIGGTTIAVGSTDPLLTLTAPAAVRPFVVATGNSDIHVTAEWCDERPAPRGRRLFDSGGLWQLHEEGDRLAWTFTSPKFGRVPYKTAVFDADFSNGTVYLRRANFEVAAPVYPLEYPLDELLVTNWLALGRGIEVHACAVRDADGAGYLFAGHSGAGKSTMAGLWTRESNVTILSDDRIILRQSGSDIWMYGTPWHGEASLASATRTLLTRGFFLRHASSHQLAAVTVTEVIARLFASSFPPFFSASGLDFTMALLTDIASAVPFVDFGFVPNRDVVGFIRATD